MLFKNLPKEIQTYLLEKHKFSEQVQARLVNDKDLTLSQAFTWMASPEEYPVWKEINRNGNFKPLAKFMKKKMADFSDGLDALVKTRVEEAGNVYNYWKLVELYERVESIQDTPRGGFSFRDSLEGWDWWTNAMETKSLPSESVNVNRFPDEPRPCEKRGMRYLVDQKDHLLAAGEIVTLLENDGSRNPQFTQESGKELYISWYRLKPYTENKMTDFENQAYPNEKVGSLYYHKDDIIILTQNDGTSDPWFCKADTNDRGCYKWNTLRRYTGEVDPLWKKDFYDARYPNEVVGTEYLLRNHPDYSDQKVILSTNDDLRFPYFKLENGGVVEIQWKWISNVNAELSQSSSFENCPCRTQINKINSNNKNNNNGKAVTEHTGEPVALLFKATYTISIGPTPVGVVLRGTESKVTMGSISCSNPS